MRRVASVLGAKALQRRRHRRGIGVVAFVDQQRLAAVEFDRVAPPAALQAAESASASPATATSAPIASTAASTASALVTQWSPRWEMVKVSSRSSNAAAIRLPPAPR